MARIRYIDKPLSAEAQAVVAMADRICREYAAAGYDLTLRQLYYQFVARGLIPNNDREYKRLGSIINDARLRGYLDWGYIVDRTRNLRSVPTWDAPSSIVEAAADSYRVDRWADQPVRPEVWIEKDALVGVIEGVCNDEQVGHFSCRGYTSQSELWGAAQRIGGYLASGQDVTVIHLGDHDPSGIDMTRDIEDRLRLFTEHDMTTGLVRELLPVALKQAGVEDWDELTDEARSAFGSTVRRRAAGYGALRVNRIALNMEQVEEHNPPPNPAKLTDSRCRGYIEVHGHSSWELDALDPTLLGDLIRDAIAEGRDEENWAAATERQEEERATLTAAAEAWADVAAFVRDRDQP